MKSLEWELYWSKVDLSDIGWRLQYNELNSKELIIHTAEGEHFYDVLIVGAGLSGIGMAWHLQNRCPGKSYAILEARESVGGTWDLFRYPGIRSDSDMYTLGFPFRPWKSEKAIADGPTILKYIKDTAEEFKIKEKIIHGQKVTKANWDSSKKYWKVSVEQVGTGKVDVKKSKFLLMCSGYYDYDKGYTPEYPDKDSFKGEFVHPQKWDESLNYEDKNIVVIGSGATAVTLVPELTKKASHVTMLQRSPTYVASLPEVDIVAELLKKILPENLAHHLIRWKNIIVSLSFFHFCKIFPAAASRLIKLGVKKSLINFEELEKDFSPKYAPWDQRLCFVPDGDLFNVLNTKKATLVTSSIKKLTEDGILLESGEKIEADIIVSATGLNLKFLGGLEITVDGETIEPRSLVPYKSTMFTGVPNLGMIFGYTNSSWTLKCNLASEWMAKIIKHVDDKNYQYVCPEKDPNVELVPLIDFSSSYFLRSKKELPKQGKKTPWKVNQNYFLDIYAFRLRPLEDEGLIFE